MRFRAGEARRRPAGESTRRRPRGGVGERRLRRNGESLRDSLRRGGVAGLHSCKLLLFICSIIITGMQRERKPAYTRHDSILISAQSIEAAVSFLQAFL